MTTPDTDAQTVDQDVVDRDLARRSWDLVLNRLSMIFNVATFQVATAVFLYTLTDDSPKMFASASGAVDYAVIIFAPTGVAMVLLGLGVLLISRIRLGSNPRLPAYAMAAYFPVAVIGALGALALYRPEVFTSAFGFVPGVAVAAVFSAVEISGIKELKPLPPSEVTAAEDDLLDHVGNSGWAVGMAGVAWLAAVAALAIAQNLFF